MSVTAIDNAEETSDSQGVASQTDSSPAHLSSIERVKEILAQKVDKPSSATLAAERISPPPAHAEKVEEALEARGIPSRTEALVGGPASVQLLTNSEEVDKKVEPHCESHPGKAVVDVAVLFEQQGVRKLNERNQLVNSYLGQIDQLLKLNGELAKLPHGESTKKLPDDVRTMLEDLQKEGLDLWNKEDVEINDAKLSQLQSLITSHIDQDRTKVQTEFTSINTQLQAMSSVIDAAKRILSDLSQLFATLTKNQRE